MGSLTHDDDEVRRRTFTWLPTTGPAAVLVPRPDLHRHYLQVPIFFRSRTSSLPTPSFEYLSSSSSSSYSPGVSFPHTCSPVTLCSCPRLCLVVSPHLSSSNDAVFRAVYLFSRCLTALFSWKSDMFSIISTLYLGYYQSGLSFVLVLSANLKYVVLNRRIYR